MKKTGKIAKIAASVCLAGAVCAGCAALSGCAWTTQTAEGEYHYTNYGVEYGVKVSVEVQNDEKGERIRKVTIIDSGYTMRGVLICGTGLGMAMCANKFPGIRAGVCHDGFSAERLALSNNGNVICFGERVVGPELAKKNLKEWMGLTFKDGPSTPKVQAICDIEAETMK